MHLFVAIYCQLDEDLLHHLLFWQLESIIGKLKAEKYGSRILEEVEKYEGSDQPDKNLSQKSQGTDNRASKRPKTKKPLVLIETSEDEEA